MLCRSSDEKELRLSLSTLSKCLNFDQKKILEKFVCERVKVEEMKIKATMELEEMSIDQRETKEKKIWNLSDGFELALKSFQLNINERVLEKLYRLHELTSKHQRILIVGPTEFGKSHLIQTFIKAKSYFEVNPICSHHLIVDVFSEEQLFGRFNEEINLFEEGLFNKILEEHPRDLCLHLDGTNRSFNNRIEDFILHFKQGILFWEVSLSSLTGQITHSFLHLVGESG